MPTINSTPMSATDLFIEKSKSSVQLRFESTLREVDKVAMQCNAIVVNDPTTLSMANQALSNANTMLKTAEEKRKEIGDPYRKVVELINKYVKDNITSKLESGIEHGKHQIKLWNEKEKKRKEEEEAINAKYLSNFENVKNKITDRLGSCLTPEQCDILIQEVNDKWPKDTYFGYLAIEATSFKNASIALIQLRRDMLVSATNITSSSMEVMTNSMAKAQDVMNDQIEIVNNAVDRVEVANSNISIAKSSVRRTKTFEVIDLEQVPRHLLMIDEKKVKEYIKELGDKVTDKGFIENGIRYFIDENVIIK